MGRFEATQEGMLALSTLSSPPGVSSSPQAGPGVSSPQAGPRPAPAADEQSAPPSFDQVYEEHFDFVWRSAKRLGVHDGAVDDVVQETFLVVQRRLPEFEGRSSPNTWVFGIVLRVARDHRRKVRRKSPHSVQYDGP